MNEMKYMALGIGGLIGLALAVGVISIYAPTVYTCPLCEATFSSLALLQEHFDSEHPGTPIDIIWE